jgi:hypothetical protein
MRRELADSAMQRSLVERAFDFNRPSLQIAWSAFTEFIRMPLDGLTTVTFGAEFHQFADRDDVLWVNFMRRIQELDGTGWSCGCSLSRVAPRELRGIQQSRWWWSEHGTIDEWMSDVERMRPFAEVVVLEGWKWEGFSE